MKSKKSLVMVTSIAAVTVITYLLVTRLAFLGWSGATEGKNKEIVKTSLGDEFLLEYVTKSFPDYETSVDVIEISTRNRIISYVIEGDYVRPNLAVQINNKTVRCYEINNYMVYKVNSGHFKGINENLIEISNLKSNEDLVIVSKALVDKKEWRWIKVSDHLYLL